MYTKSFGNHNFDFIFNAMDQSYRWIIPMLPQEYLTNAGKELRGVGGPQEYIMGLLVMTKRAAGIKGRVSYNYNSK
jgi:hypothetical protein